MSDENCCAGCARHLDGADLCPSCYRGALDASEFQAERREFWCEIVVTLIRRGWSDDSTAAKAADAYLEEFDKRFAPKTDNY